MPGHGNGPSSEDQRYYVKRASGKVFGPFDKSAIRMMLKSQKIGAEAAVSVDKQNWNPVSAIPAFTDLVDGLDAGDEANRTKLGGFAAATGALDSEPDDLPKPKRESGGAEGAGGPQLPKPKMDGGSSGDGGPPDLPTPKERSEGGGGPQLPRPKDSGPKDGGRLDLPKPKSTGGDGPPDLPKPKSKDASPASQDDPSAEPPTQEAPPELKESLGISEEDGNQDLPRSAEPELPRSAEPDLPRSAEGDLPRSAQGDLPRSAQGDLPRSAQGDLPRSAQGDLPRSAQDDLPRSSEDNLPRSGGGDLPRSAGGNLPQAGEDRLPESAEEPESLSDSPEFQPAQPGGPPPEDNLFEEEADDDLFAEDVDEDDDLFAEEEEEDDLFADDEDDDLFAEEEDDLFADPEEKEDADLFADEPEEDDLFAESEANIGGGRSFGEEDANRREEGLDFLDSESEAQGGGNIRQQPPPGGGPSPGAPGAEQDFGEDIELDEEAASQAGVSTNRGGGRAAGAAEGAASGERAAPRADSSGGISRGIVAAAAIVGLLAAGGAAYYFVFAGDGDTGKQEKSTQVTPGDVDVSKLDKDTFKQFQAIFKSAKSKQLTKTGQGKLLLAQSLFLSRYSDSKLEKQAKELAKSLEKAEEGYPAVGRGAWAANRGNLEVAKAYLSPLFEASDEKLAYFARLAAGVGYVQVVASRDVRRPRATEEASSIPDTARESEDDDSEGKEGTDEAEEKDSKEAGSKGAGKAEEKAPNDPSEGSQVAQKAGDAGTRADAEGEQKAADKDKNETMTLADEGIEVLEDAKSTSKKAAQPYYWQGRLHEAIAENDKALDQYETALKQQSNHVPSRLRAARLHYASGDLKGAVKQTNKILSELGSVAGDPETAEAYHVEGLVHAAQSSSNKAIESFTKAIEKDASRSETLRQLAEAYGQAGKHQEALNFFQSNKALEKKNPEVLLGIVRSHMGLEQWQSAINELERGEEMFPKDARFPYFLGKLHLKRGAFSDARKAMERAVGIDSKLLEAYGTLAQLVWKLEKDPSEGEYYVQQIVQKPRLIDASVATKVAGYYRMSDRRELAKKWYREALRRNPNAWPARLALAKMYLQEEETQKALKLLKKAKEAGVEDIRLSAYLADAYRQSEEYDRALKAINKVIKLKPENAEYVFIRGLIHFDRGNLDTARRDFNKAYEVDPLYHRAYFYVGRTAFKQDDYKNAIKIFRQVLDDRPENGEYRYWMGRAFESRGRLEDALSEYKNVTKFDKTYGIENPKLFIRRGRLLVKLGYPEKGKAEISKALEVDPEMTTALLAKAEADYSSENYETAIENFKSALEKKPEVAWAQYKMGMSLVYAKRERQGVQHLQKAVKYGYEDPEIYKTLGYLYKGLGKRRLAIESFKSYLRQTPKDELPASTRREMVQQIKDLGG